MNNFAATSDILYIATNGGVGRWDYTQGDWINPLTTSDGLPTNVVEDVLVEVRAMREARGLDVEPNEMTVGSADA